MTAYGRFLGEFNPGLAGIKKPASTEAGFS